MGHVSLVMEDLLRLLEHRHESRPQPPSLSTGLSRLDDVTGGLDERRWMIRGRPGSGTTALALHIARAAASGQAAVPVVYVTTDLSCIGLCARLVAGIAKIDVTRLLSAELDQGAWNDVAQAVDLLNDLPLHLIDARGANAAAVCRLVWSARAPLVGKICLILDSADRVPSTTTAALSAELLNTSDLAVLVDREEQGAPVPGWVTAELVRSGLGGDTLLTVLSGVLTNVATEDPIPEVNLHIDRRFLTVREADP